jgi:hypothetical protein
MAVALDVTGVKNVGASSAVTTFTCALAASSGLSNGAIIAWITFGNTTAPTSVTATWDVAGANQAMFQVGTKTFTGTGGTATGFAFALRGPTTTGTSKNITFNWTGTGNFPTACAISLTGVDQTSNAAAFKNFVSNSGNVPAAGGTLSTTVTSATGDMVIGGFADSVAVSGAIINNTVVWSDTTTSGADAAGCRAAGAATVTVTGTGGSGSGAGIVFGFDVAAAGAAAAVPQGWQNLDNDIFPPRAISFSQNPALQSPPFTTTTTIAGIAWQGPRDHVKLPPKGAVSDAPAYGKPPFTVPGVAWTEPPDRDKAPVKATPDSAPPAYGQFVPAVGVSGIGWYQPPDRDKPSVKVSQDATPPAYGRFIPAVGISGNGWFLPLEIALPKAKVASDPPAFGRPITTPVPISGIAWDTLHETDILPKGKYLTDPVAVPYAPQTSTWAFLVGDTTFIRDAPIDIPPTMGTTPTAAVTVPVSGIAWYTQTDQTKVRVSFDQPPAHVLRPFAAVNTNAGIPWFEPADVDKKPVRINGEAQPGFAFAAPPVRISGMAWYEPADRDRPALKVSIESSPAFAVFAPAAPVGVSGMAWFAPKPDSVVVQVSFSQAPALQQPIVQLVPPPDDGTRGSETILTDRRGAGQFTRRQYDEFLKAKRAAEHKARLLKKKPGAELRKAIEVAEEAVAKAGLLGDIAPSIEPITDALFDAADANVAQVAAEAREAIRIAEALLAQMDEEREEEAVLMLLLTS